MDLTPTSTEHGDAMSVDQTSNTIATKAAARAGPGGSAGRGQRELGGAQLVGERFGVT